MSEETHPGEAQTSVGTPDYMEKARELADSYPQLLARKQELKRQMTNPTPGFIPGTRSSTSCRRERMSRASELKQAVRPTRWNAPSSTATRYWHP